MRFSDSIWIAAALGTAVLAAPALDVHSEDVPLLSDYFQLLGQKVAAQRSLSAVPVCDLSKAVMPASNLPSPAAGLTLAHVAIGRGTQNYTCPGNNDTAVPTSVGAVATLYNASCVASTFPEVLALLPNVTLQFTVPSTGAVMAPASLAISGHHFFINATPTPFFTLDTTSMQIGSASCAKNASVPAPAGSPLGPHGVGNGSVAWLQLLAKDGATGGLSQVYRLNTAGGSPPTTCAGMPTSFQVQYAAEYWFWKSG